MRLKPYRDTTGNLTIGVGRNLDDVGISRDEATILLKNDIDHVVLELSQFGWVRKLDPIRFGVVVNMAFNIGVPGLLKFPKMLVSLKSGNYTAAAREMLKSKWAKQVGDRAVRLARQMEEGKELL